MEQTHFTKSRLPDDLIEEMKQVGTWKGHCPVPLNRLRLLKIPHYDFDTNIIQGEMVVFDVVADDVLTIFKELFALQFPIARMRRIEHYDGMDRDSMEGNNSSCFNYRQMIGNAERISMHSYGLAIDVNPKQNPFVVINEEEGTAKIYPKAGFPFLNRKEKRRGMVEEIVPIFAQHGFVIWGGDWKSPLDWHHFQTHRFTAEIMIAMGYEDGKEFFRLNKRYPEAFKKMADDKLSGQLLKLYWKDSRRFNDLFEETIIKQQEFSLAFFMKEMTGRF